ncbi:unnamed protein product [Cylindrotheca closterium]|uniref:Orc1-like AAA ATPase domain-containing protein n=1 Tax=Cylindrotheca closterium TaxID=2856 RepID=A0AAD2CRC9_9STRA|nr:unnamed protein product [Cylindrotheca closterium]
MDTNMIHLPGIRIAQILTVVTDGENDLPSQFGDDDALLSIAGTDADFSHVRSAPPSTGTGPVSETSSLNSGFKTLKTSELRRKRTLDNAMRKYQVEDSSQHSSETLKFATAGLIGREQETSLLKGSFHRLKANTDTTGTTDSEPRKELVLLGGTSGVGKSSIAKDLKVSMEREKVGYFVEGKFDMNTRDEPYSGVCDALGIICHHIIERNQPDSVAIVRGELEQKLGEESSLLCHLIPELKGIMYDQPQEPSDTTGGAVHLDVEELENGLDRLRYAFRILIRALSAEFAPLVLLLDDLQWADVSSLQVLDFVISDTQNPNPIMILGCYRSDEVDENSLLYNKIQSLRDKSSRFAFAMTEITVEPFSAIEVEKIIIMAVGSHSSEETLKLSEVCVKRTLGNPFFVLEFLKMLRNEGLIAYNEPSQKWTWDLERIEDATMSTANVVVLLQERMRKLSGQMQAFLQYAAHLGSSFSEETIKIIWQTYGRRVAEGEMEAVPKLLQLVVDGNYLEKLDATHYRWVHDKVQEAALYLAGTLREAHHLDIGTSLYYCLEAKQLEEDLFNVVDLINKGNIRKRPEFASVNLRAAEKARGISAFAAAAKYAAHGIELLKDTRWSQNRQLTLRLYTIGAEMERVLGNVAVAERYSSEVLSRPELDKLQTLPLKLGRASTLSTVQLKFEETVSYCLDVLKELGCKLFVSRKLLASQAIITLIRTIRRVKNLPLDYFDKAKTMDDEKQKGISALVARMLIAAYLSGDIMLAILSACKLVEISLHHGINEFSAKSITTLAIATIVVQQDFKAATKFNDMALGLVKKHRRMHNGETMFNVYNHGHIWVKPMDSCLPAVWDAYQFSTRSGDVEYAGWNLVLHQILLPFYFGKPLPQILTKCPAVMHQLEEAAQSQQILIHKIIWQTMANLHDSSCREPGKLEGEIFSETKNTGKDNLHIATVLLAKGELLLFHGDYSCAADRAIEHGDLYQKMIPANFANIFETFHRALALYTMALRTRKKKYKKEALRLRRMIKRWVVAIENPEFNYFKTILDAEQFAMEKKHEKAERHYDEAIKSATSRGHLHHAGLFRERYAEYLLREPANRGRCNEQLKEAIAFYKQWGADGKVKTLESNLVVLGVELSAG